MGAQTVVADVADELARRVVIGELAPGDLMPSVRQVAEEFAMNRATAQLVLGRLESYGFVDAHRGRGFTVRDVRRAGGVEVYRRLFRLSVPAPELAAEMFRDIVDTERAIVLDALLAYTENGQGGALPELRADLEELENLARAATPDHARLLAVEVGLVRRLLTELGQDMQRAVLNSLGELLSEVPQAVEAHYAVSADLHVLVWQALLAVWESGSGPSQAQLTLFEDLFGMYLEKVVARFEELVLGAPGAHEFADSRTATA
ncbi:GntR family transcriptional regulator [Nocardia huaxiensis]|uniref:GntR family transcriptional regulator n=1 Tax=Nocardia huaxiensis TaxID=2755382 RepID=A0A7D6V997_9NOCA|nr:GntR family transcriptional regulator [Nocardia huaxiensis]QLY29533.1 GntR family transcriptional regulator [Nocardia huaxiensis]UFS96908.1 GntR family transcriptional regulator [Nocardia huaxiensis]